ncbi:hypothetical protein [Streptomyces spiramenti]|uniref:Secreted protein n=1 Tax=Streptomyces spiramenti TaxID=2720606 RepID=A0ABX1API3_9ACTN|nr:hypothetical protein [Streptomyces spiramenti]NJP66990.1 hypothetical protein [Streptomyces spiramenti]
MRPSRPATRLAALALLPLLLATACSTAGEAPTPPDPDPAVESDDTERSGGSDATAVAEAVLPTASLTADLTLPLDAYHISAEDQRVLEEARDLLVTACMARYGQEYTPADHRAADLGTHLYLYGVDDAGIAAEHGYMHPVDLDPATYAPAFPQELTPDQELALHGDPGLDLEHPETLEEAQRMSGPELGGEPVPVTGCHGEATLTVNRPDADWVDPTVILQLADEAAHLADEDPRLDTLLADWSACMADQGWETDTPLEAAAQLGLGGDVSGTEAREAAVADVGCKEETELVTRWAAIDSDHQATVIEEHAGMLADYREQHEERMTRARAVL